MPSGTMVEGLLVDRVDRHLRVEEGRVVEGSDLSGPRRQSGHPGHQMGPHSRRIRASQRARGRCGELLRLACGVFEAAHRHRHEHVRRAARDIWHRGSGTAPPSSVRPPPRSAPCRNSIRLRVSCRPPVAVAVISTDLRRFGKPFRQKERGSNLRWSPSTVRALPGMCPNRSCGARLPGGSRPGRTYML